MSGLTKPGKVSDIVALVSMKSPYSCPKGKVLVTHEVFGSQLFFSLNNNHTFSSIFMHTELPCS